MKRVTIRVPATTANLGPGFDAFGCALSLYTDVTFEEMEDGLDCITHAKKPFSKGINECLAKYGIPASQAALIGDQIYTDTLGANGANVTSILVKAIDNHNFWLKARHVLEKPFIFAARNRRI